VAHREEGEVVCKSAECAAPTIITNMGRGISPPFFPLLHYLFISNLIFCLLCGKLITNRKDNGGGYEGSCPVKGQ
jgi:hypothetical protein